jgi:hypothetical protein
VPRHWKYSAAGPLPLNSVASVGFTTAAFSSLSDALAADDTAYVGMGIGSAGGAK